MRKGGGGRGLLPPLSRSACRVDEWRRTCSWAHTHTHSGLHSLNTHTDWLHTSTCNNFMCPSTHEKKGRQSERERKSESGSEQQPASPVASHCCPGYLWAIKASGNCTCVLHTVQHPLPPPPSLPNAFSSPHPPHPPARCYVCQLSTSTDVSALLLIVLARQMLITATAPLAAPSLRTALHLSSPLPLLFLRLCLIIMQHNSFLDRVCHWIYDTFSYSCSSSSSFISIYARKKQLSPIHPLPKTHTQLPVRPACAHLIALAKGFEWRH